MVMWLYGLKPVTLDHLGTNFVLFRDCGGGDKTFFICHVISNDHVLKELCDFVGGAPQ